MTTPSDQVPAVTVVVVNWNSGPYLARLLRSLVDHPPKASRHVVVVDNASSDGSADVAAGAPGTTLLRNTRNRGLAAANNQGMAMARGPYVLLANPDVELTAGAVDEMLAVMGRHPRAAFVIPRLFGGDGTCQPSAGDLPTLGEALLGRTMTGLLSRRRSRGAGGTRRGFWWHGWAHDEETIVGHGAEACYLVRRCAIDDFGRQDERFRLDWEGVEWAARAAESGWETWLAPEATVLHAGGVSISRAPLRWVWQSHQGMYRYFAAQVEARWRPVLAAAVAARAVLKGLAVVARLPVYRWAR